MSLKDAAVTIAGKFTNRLHFGNGLDQRQLAPVGWFNHTAAVERLQRSFAAVPAGQRVRLAKKTSNLFRGRSGTLAGLDVSGLHGVIAVDPVNRTADVQGMCTYEDLVDTLLPFGLVPTVVPQLKTITLGGAVTGMGVESTSFRNGLPHEAVLDMDVLTGTGDIVTCSPEVNTDLYRGFPNSYGSLGYCVRLKITCEAAPAFVALRHVRFNDVDSLTATLAEISESREYDGEQVDYLDGVVFSLQESYLTLGRQTNEPGPVSDYTRGRIFYRSLQHPEGISHDRLTVRDYIWRWDIDWFWCNRAFGAQNPTVRTLWPRDLLRSSFYWKIIGWDRRFDIADRIEAHHGRPPRERVVQDVEVVPDNLPSFLTWFFTHCEIEPVWLCPIRLREGVDALATRTDVLDSEDAARHPWPLYPLTPGDTWVNVGFWSSVPADLTGTDAAPGAFNREIERVVDELGGHKSLYSEAFYTPEQFSALYGGDLPEKLKKIYDPHGRFPGLYEKTVTSI